MFGTRKQMTANRIKTKQIKQKTKQRKQKTENKKQTNLKLADPQSPPPSVGDQAAIYQAGKRVEKHYTRIYQA